MFAQPRPPSNKIWQRHKRDQHFSNNTSCDVTLHSARRLNVVVNCSLLISLFDNEYATVLDRHLLLFVGVIRELRWQGRVDHRVAPRRRLSIFCHTAFTFRIACTS